MDKLKLTGNGPLNGEITAEQMNAAIAELFAEE